jgi:integrase
MAKLSIRITHIAWRDGRPRFEPGPLLRALGFKGEDLRHGPQGPWFEAAEALAWSQAKEQEIAARRRAKAEAEAKGKRLAPIRRAAGRFYTMEDLFEDYFKSPRMRGEMVVEGKRRQKAAAAATIKDYRKKAKAIGEFDGVLWTAPVDALSKPILYDLYERLWTRAGLATARGAIAVLSAAISWGIKRGKVRLPVNPCMGLGMEMPEARLRCLTPQEVRQLVATADALGRPEIGDAIVMGVWTGQRQKDRLELLDAGLMDGRRLFRQSKTKAIVELKEAPELEARLAAAKLRRESWTVQPLHIIVDERARQSFKADHYRHLFSEIRTEAAKELASLADARDQDLRDTSVTWLARAGCTHMEIAQLTGHSMQSIQTILKHYLAHHREIADNAIDKMVKWYEGQGA